MTTVNHPWNLSPAEAISLQKRLSPQVIREDDLSSVEYVAGVYVGFEQKGTITRAAVAVLKFPELTLCDFKIARQVTELPYIPGLLSFKECPAILTALAELSIPPDLILCDGHGIAHPRGLGVASHLGLLTGLPTIGVAKSCLCGTSDDLPEKKGNQVPLTYKGRVVGVVLRSRDGVRPLYVSIGHKVSLATAVDYVQACLTRFRLPETTRWADALASNRGQALDKARRLVTASQS